MARGGKRQGAGRRPGKTGPVGPQIRTIAVREAVRKSHELTAQATLEQIRRGSQFDIRALFDEKGNLRPIHTLTAEEAMPIAGFEVLKRNVTSGDDKVDTVLKVKLIDRSRYVEMAARHHGLLVDKLEVTGEVTLMDKIAKARQRIRGGETSSHS